ncbi:MAG: phospholipase D-like domain-containing protein [Caldisphaera sp.]
MQLVENDKVKLVDIVSDLIKHSTEIRLAIAFVRKSGVDLLSSELQAFRDRGGSLKLIFGEDFNLTEGLALDHLQGLGADMKVYLAKKGVYHPKIWMFKLPNKWVVVVGSSNLSKDALTNNVEASIVLEGDSSDQDISACLTAFDVLWGSDCSFPVDKNYINNYKNEVKRYFSRRIAIAPSGTVNSMQAFTILKETIKSWIDIPVSQKYENNSIWRGWYFLPNQTVITEDYLSKLQKILLFIKNHNQYSTAGYLDIPTNATGEQICRDMYAYAGITFKRRNLKLSARDLFIRQQKNYLEKLGFIKEERKKIMLTTLGNKFSVANMAGMKDIYESILIEYKWYEVHPFLFMLKLLLTLEDNKLLYNEFSFFVVHVKHDTEFDVVYDLIMAYRLLSASDKAKLEHEVNNYLQRIKGTGANMVIEDYNLKLDFFLKDISVFSYLNYNKTTGILKLVDKAKAQKILNDSDYI